MRGYVDHILKQDAATKRHEFVAFAMSNNEFQDMLKSIPYKKDETLWDRLVSIWSDLLRSLGLDVDSDNLLAATISEVASITKAPTSGPAPSKVTKTTKKFDPDDFLPGNPEKDIVSLTKLYEAGIIDETTAAKAIELQKKC